MDGTHTNIGQLPRPFLPLGDFNSEGRATQVLKTSPSDTLFLPDHTSAANDVLLCTKFSVYDKCCPSMVCGGLVLRILAMYYRRHVFNVAEDVNRTKRPNTMLVSLV